MANNEVRLIDANALIRVCEWAKTKNKPSEECATALDLCIELFKQAPTVDAVEVVHGRWEEHPRDTYAKEHHCEKLRCTHCWHFFYHNYGDGKMYCPNCGAKMDGDGDA